MACFVLPFIVVFSSSASTPPLLSSLSSLPASSPSFAHTVMERAKVFRISTASDYLLMIVASVRNGGRRTALRGVQLRYFLDRLRLLEAAQRRNPVMGRWILLPSAEIDVHID